MSYARAAWAQPPYAGTVLPAPNVGELPPPIPGDAASFSYNNQLGAYPWAMATWAGGYRQTAYPGGGVLAHANDDLGVMTVTAWWPDAPVLSLVRIALDGTRTTVRGAYPLTVASPTRRNYCTNPSLEAGLNGYVPDAGSPTLSQLADAAAPAGAFVLRATNAGAGSNGVTVPTSAPAAPTVAPGGQFISLGFAMRCSARPTSVTVTVAWTDVAGGALTTNSTTLSANQINQSVSQFARQIVTFTAPANAITPTWKIVCGGMPAGGTVDLDALSFEVGLTDGSFFDGDSLAAVWAGTNDLSVSILAPIQTILDGECPTDTPVTYQLSFPGITGGRVISDPATLLSNGTTWLTHPQHVDTPIAVNVTEVPEQERDVPQGVFLPIGASKPVVVSAAQRQASTGTLQLVAFGFAERDALLGLFAVPEPMLLRPPGIFGYTALWLAFGKVTEQRNDRKAWQDTVFLSCEFTEVDAPSVL